MPRPSQDEIRQYMAQHPNTFAQRKIYVVDRIEIPATTSRKVLDAIKPLHSMDDIEQVLLNASIDYVRAPAAIDARSTAPTIIDQIAKMPPGEPFVIPDPDRHDQPGEGSAHGSFSGPAARTSRSAPSSPSGAAEGDRDAPGGSSQGGGRRQIPGGLRTAASRDLAEKALMSGRG